MLRRRNCHTSYHEKWILLNRYVLLPDRSVLLLTVVRKKTRFMCRWIKHFIKDHINFKLLYSLTLYHLMEYRLLMVDWFQNYTMMDMLLNPNHVIFIPDNNHTQYSTGISWFLMNYFHSQSYNIFNLNLHHKKLYCFRMMVPKIRRC